MSFDPIMQKLEATKHLSPKGGEYWMARDIQHVLGYDKWDNFRNVLEKAKEACRSAGVDPKYHFLDTGKMITTGKGAQREREDCYVTRYACYLIAMGGDTSKAEIGSAQTYFAIQTRRQEVADLSLNDEKRLELRESLKEAVKHLNSAAKNSGVVNYAYFHDAGYRGLYGMGLKALKAKKGISEGEQLFDRAGRLELSANEFKANLTEQSILHKGIKGQTNAENEHTRVGRIVRQTIKQEVGVNPEDLPAEPSIKAIGGRVSKRLDNP